MTRVEDGRARDEVAEHLVGLATEDPELLVGFDFSFSLPAWFLRDRGLGSADELWAVPDAERERWLTCAAPPFWGRTGRTRPELPEHLRRTERAVEVHGIRPKSTFQVSGAGTVGAGSLRGFPVLATLRTHGFSIWPFDDASPPAVFEVWPRLLTGAVVKSSRQARVDALQHLATDAPGAEPLPEWALARAATSEDAFDALVSAIVMARHADELRALRRTEDPVEQLEGAMWVPRIAPGNEPASVDPVITR